MPLQTPRGTKDILPGEVEYFQFLEATARELFANYGYGEIRTPVFEVTELFARGIGEETDIVSKEMYTFEDRKGRSMTLRPEGTAPVVRSMIEHHLLKMPGSMQKVFYLGPMFRYEKPQEGRQRQFHTAGVEFFGCPSPLADAEVIAMLSAYLKALGFQKPIVKVNTLGNAASRQAYNEELRRRLADIKDSLCADCRRRADVNPLRVLDCKVPEDQARYAEFPPLRDFLDDESRAHYAAVLQALEKLDVDFEERPGLVRGFDYYTHTVFETTLEGLGAQDAVLGGGRYDGLMAQLGGPDTPAVGAGFGLERLIIAMQKQGIAPPAREDQRPVYILALDDDATNAALEAAQAIRAVGKPALFDFARKSFKAGLKVATRANASHLLLIGSDELASGQYQIKDLDSQQQESVASDALGTCFKG